MKRRLFLAIGAIGMGVLAAACSPEKKAEQKAPPTEVRLAVHKSFDLPQPLIAKFEQENHAKVNVIKVGGGGELVLIGMTVRCLVSAAAVGGRVVVATPLALGWLPDVVSAESASSDSIVRKP